MDDPCVICGEAAEVVMSDSDRRYPVCASHIMPAYRLAGLLAVAEFKQAIRQEFAPLVDRLGRMVELLLEHAPGWLPLQVRVLAQAREQGEVDDNEYAEVDEAAAGSSNRFDVADKLEPDTLDEALNRIGGWGRLIRHAIEHGEVIPREAFLVSFRDLTEAEIAYGRALIPADDNEYAEVDEAAAG